MNGLTLRINKVGGGKTKNSIGFAPVDVSTFLIGKTGTINEQLKSFIEATTTDDQLVTLKKILDSNKDSVDGDIVKFLVAVFLQAEAKHPVKCFITRYITKNTAFHQPFTDELSNQISTYITTTTTEYKQYIDVVSRVVTCIENFPVGVAALRAVEIELAGYLKNSLECCVKTLREATPSPTEKNEIYNLAHLSLRLLLHIVQKCNTDNISKLILMFDSLRMLIEHLLFDDDSPMDTKSVCGILFLSMHVMEHGPDSWVNLLNPEDMDHSLRHLLAHEASQLALYSAVATVVSADRLHAQTIRDAPAIVLLTNKILEIGERSSSESTFILGVSRTVVQISKQLERTATGSAWGLGVVQSVLRSVWTQLDHYMDSVRHLAAQALGCVVRYCARLKKEGDDKAVKDLFKALSSLDRARKSYYVTLTCLTSELGAAHVIHMVPDVIVQLIAALSLQPVQASVTVALETLLSRHAAQCDTASMYRSWVRPALRRAPAAAAAELTVLENLLARALQLHDGLIHYLKPHFKESTEVSPKQLDLKCILMLLSVARKSGVTSKLSSKLSTGEWKGLVGYQLLQRAAVDAAHETRIRTLSLIVESSKSTEEFTAEDLDLVLWYVRYNINAQAPSFRQHTLSLMKKFMKRLEDSYRVLKRQKEVNGADDKVGYYLRFMENLRELCFDSLLRGANLSRRCVALQLLVWSQQLDLEGYNRNWTSVYAEKLLYHLDDSYEGNKALALEMLLACPVELLKSESGIYLVPSASLDLGYIFEQASSLKPTECVSAAYKLELVLRKLPQYILQGETCVAVEPVAYTLLRKLLARLQEQLRVCETCMARGARQAPMYGLLHCMRHVLLTVDPLAISPDDNWSRLVAELVCSSMVVSRAVAGVVNNSSPEGHLPMDMTRLQLSDHGNTDGLRLDDGRLVTAQMVLLCAWRSVKEVSLLLGSICSRLSIRGEGAGGSLSVDQVIQIGEHFTSLLAETKHRGAFEQAYVGFTQLLSRLWRCSSAALHSLPRAWLRELQAAVSAPETSSKLCATRRSAGLPYMIQALVTTELQVQDNPAGFRECMAWLLRLAGPGQAGQGRGVGGAARSHALNILRALFRNSALDESVAPYVGRGLLLALEGFEAPTWPERNSSTLLFSALMVRVFGVARSRKSVCARNRMTGRIFFLRYPQLYDYMLDKLQEVSRAGEVGEASVVRAALVPALLLLGRLYPSALEGTVSNLKLAAFIPHVVRCGGSGALQSRLLAARAAVPLVGPEQYIPHLESMFQLLNDTTIKRNFCHGILLQIIELLDAKPKDLTIERSDLMNHVKGTVWILEQSLGVTPCYMITDEYVKALNLMVWRLPSLFEIDTIQNIMNLLHTLIFNSKTPKINSGRDVCLANSTYLYLILLNKYNMNSIHDIVCKGLVHSSYEVVLSVLNYVLILYNSLETENQFQEHLLTADKTVLRTLTNDKIPELLRKHLNNKYLECKQKSLIVLTIQDKCRKYTSEKELVNDVVEERLSEYIQNGDDNLSHIYLEALLHYVGYQLEEPLLHDRVLLRVITIVLESSSSDNSDSKREAAVSFLEQNIMRLLRLELRQLEERERFEFKATVWASTITLLEDDEESFRQRMSDAVGSMLAAPSRVIPSVCAEMILRDYIGTGFECEERIALLTVLALLDFKSVVCMYDDVEEEARVFDQNEKYNIFLEETVWTNACADKIKSFCKQDQLDAFIVDVINRPLFYGTFRKLCGSNITFFQKIVTENCTFKSDELNPKIEMFVYRLRE